MLTFSHSACLMLGQPQHQQACAHINGGIVVFLDIHHIDDQMWNQKTKGSQ